MSKWTVLFCTTNVLKLRRTRKFCAAESGCRHLSNRSFLTADDTDSTDSRKESLSATAARINAEIQLHQARKGKWPLSIVRGDEDPRVTQEPEDLELRSLLVEHRDTRKEIASVVDADARKGVAPFVDVIAANEALLDAELEFARSQQERIAIVEKMLDAQNEVERILSEIVESGGRGAEPQDLLIAKAARLKVEIDLHKARKKAK